MKFTSTEQSEMDRMISIMIRVDKIISKKIPLVSSDNDIRNTTEQLLDVTIEATGIQDFQDDLIPVRLSFYFGLFETETLEVKSVYELGKLFKVQGEYTIKISDQGLPCVIEIYNPMASPVSVEIIQIQEEIDKVSYLPQWTLESAIASAKDNCQEPLERI